MKIEKTLERGRVWLPKSALNQLGIKENEKVLIDIVENKITIEKEIKK